MKTVGLILLVLGLILGAGRASAFLLLAPSSAVAPPSGFTCHTSLAQGTGTMVLTNNTILVSKVGC